MWMRMWGWVQGWGSWGSNTIFDFDCNRTHFLNPPPKPHSQPDARNPTQAESGAPLTTRARLLSGRALAHEGLSKWAAALADYDAALQVGGGGVFWMGGCSGGLGEVG